MSSFTKEMGYLRYNAAVYKSDDNFLYQRDSCRNGRAYLRCVKPDCQARAVADETSGEFKRTKTHSHNTSAYDQRAGLRNLLKRKAAESLGGTSNSQLFREVTRNHEQGASISFPSIESSMQRAKRRTHPRLPATAQDCAEMLQEDQAANFNQHLQAVVATDQESGEVGIAMIFFNLSLLTHILPHITNMNFDGTFFTVPGIFYQLFNILVVYKDHSIPAIHVLMSSKKESLYSKVIEKIRELLPSLSPLQAMGDFEGGSGNAIRRFFPTTQVGGCQFHYAKCIFKKLTKLGLSEDFSNNAAFKKWAKTLMALAYLPAAEIQTAADRLFDQLTQILLDADKQVLARRLKDYFYRYWIRTVTPEKFSVFDFSRGTNNDAESFHSRLKSIIRTHKPNLFSFLSHLNNVMDDAKMDVARLDEGLQITRKRKAKFVQNIARREEYKQKLSSGIFTVQKFLNAVVHTLDTSIVVSENLDNLELAEGDLTEEQGNLPAAEEAEVPQELQCSVCLQRRERTIVLLPCWHGTFCAGCIEVLSATNASFSCPICRTPVQDKHEVF